MPTMCQVTLKTTDSVPENFITNQYATSSEISSPTDADLMVTAIKTFYDAIRGTILGNSIAQNGHMVKFYNLPGVTPNYPYYESTFDLTSAPAGAVMPAEVAICLSFQGSRTAGQFQARRRGRVFIGPLSVGTNAAGRPSSTVRTTLTDAAEDFFDDVDAIASAGSWAVWSPTDGVAVPLVEAWCDDSYDTQRSRGLGVTSKTVVSLV